jgi:hypothetical protein
VAWAAYGEGIDATGWGGDWDEGVIRGVKCLSVKGKTGRAKTFTLFGSWKGALRECQS